MSGGSYEYAYLRVEDMAQSMRERHPGDPLSLAFADHLQRVAKAMHAVEWADSSDWPWSDAEKEMRGIVSPAMQLDAAIGMALAASKALDQSIARAGEAR